jgi:hypothetical protein
VKVTSQRSLSGDYQICLPLPISFGVKTGKSRTEQMFSG